MDCMKIEDKLIRRSIPFDNYKKKYLTIYNPQIIKKWISKIKFILEYLKKKILKISVYKLKISAISVFKYQC